MDMHIVISVANSDDARTVFDTLHEFGDFSRPQFGSARGIPVLTAHIDGRNPASTVVGRLSMAMARAGRKILTVGEPAAIHFYPAEHQPAWS